MTMCDEQWDKIRLAKDDWERRYKVDQSPPVSTDLDIPLQAIYTPADVAHIDYLASIGLPGEYPFTRGPYPEMSRHKPWRYSVFTGFDAPEQTNARWKFLYRAGQRAFSILYDLPTHMGYDPDDPIAEDDVGRVGVPICNTRDLEAAFRELPMGTVPFYGNVETVACFIVSFYIAAGERRGLTPGDLAGNISNDPLSTAISKSTVVFPVKHAFRLACDLIEYACRNMPRFYPINIKAVNIVEAGCSIAHEVAYGLSNAMCYLDECLRRGLDVDTVASRITFFFGTTPHLFEEVAKYRAARRLWARLMKEEYGAKDHPAMALKFTAAAAPLWFEFEEPELNLVRGAVAGLAQALGGAQATPHPCYDEVFTIPTQKSQSLALGTQQVLAEETNITKVVDPLGGSYYVEWLTEQVEKRIAELMAEVKERGGAVAAIEDGYQKQETINQYNRLQDDIASGERIIVRRNKYRVDGEEDPWARVVLHQPNFEAIQRYVQGVRQLKQDRDNARVQACLKTLEDAARGPDNLMPYLIDAARAYVTLGEMTSALRRIFGSFKAPIIV